MANYKQSLVDCICSSILALAVPGGAAIPSKLAAAKEAATLLAKFSRTKDMQAPEHAKVGSTVARKLSELTKLAASVAGDQGKAIIELRDHLKAEFDDSIEPSVPLQNGASHAHAAGGQHERQQHANN